MKMSKLLVFLFLFSISFFASGNTADSARKVIYYNQFLAGGLFGKTENIATLGASTIHGVKFKGAAIGLGLAYDAYRDWKTTPFLISFSVDLGRPKNNSLYLQLDSGAGRAKHMNSNFQFANFDVKASRFIHSAIGYRIKADCWSLYIKAGYKFQRIKYNESWGGAWVNKVTMDLERISLQVGFGWH
jgi:hypothetical protein